MSTRDSIRELTHLALAATVAAAWISEHIRFPRRLPHVQS